jgi:site-specific DNA-methyltransferase (adenine-specific)
VADPFMGSGSVGIAATKLGRRFLGNDLNPEAVQIAARRLSVGRVPPEQGATKADPPTRRTAPVASSDTEPMQADLLDSVRRA